MSGMKMKTVTTMSEASPRKHYRNRNADDRQAELFQHFPPDSFLGDEKNVDHFIQWVTFFRRNFHRFAMDYLGIKLYLYQIVILYLMGLNSLFVIIASRADAKSFIVALGACIYCILYPNSMVVIASGTKKQAKLLVSEKIEKELMKMSAPLRKEIRKIKDNQNEVIVYFKNGSTVTVVAPGDGGRGYRSTVLVREEFRQIKKEDEDGVLSPYQIVRPVPYMKDEFYANVPELQEEPMDIYISSSWIDNGTSWLWKTADQACDEMLKGKDSCLLAFDEAVSIRHRIKTMRYFQREKKKQDKTTWETEFLNLRVKENTSAYFTYDMLERNQRLKKPWYPRTLADFRAGKKNPYDIQKQNGEIRVVSCDMAFVENKRNDNSIFTCYRALPESYHYARDEVDDLEINKGYRRIPCFMDSVQGGDTVRQAIRIRQLMEDFDADYLVLDTRNGGIAVYDMLARVLYDDERGVEYSPLRCMNDENIANRIFVDGARECVYAINASQKLNSEIAIDFRRMLTEGKIDLLVNFEKASEEILPNIKEYVSAPDGDTQIFYERPFLETQEFISETTGLVYEKKTQTGAIVISEQGTNRKDRYTSASYGSYFISQLELDLLSTGSEYDFVTLVN